ncbi:spermidine synthase [Catellatospora vulcania]|uniref:spermidine synthase n=1 Tax=Catellatospora vulcania TaxID=1460450 RepID=UPI0012D49595|nr:fused MFS/spermidine synthase [Catellatospora vulcania]
MARSARLTEPIVEQVDAGTAALVPDVGRRGGWTLFVDDTAQSYVHLTDPTHLEFGYVRRIATVIDAAAPAGAPLRVLHLGGGALTLPRYVEATRPGSTQRVIEYDRKLYTLVRRVLPLPPGDLRVRIADACHAVAAVRPDTFDLVITDLYQGDQMPHGATTAGFAGDVARALRPGGLYAANLLDTPAYTFTDTQTATARAEFADVCLIADDGFERRAGQHNVVLAAVTAPGPLPMAGLAGRLNGPPRGRILHGADLAHPISAARPRTGAPRTTRH